MDHALAMGEIEGVGELRDQMRGFAKAEAAPLEPVREADAVHQLGNEIERVVVAADVVNGDDARMMEPGGGPRLAQETLFIGRAEDLAGPGELQGHVALQLGVPGPPHGAKGAGAEQVAQLVTAKACERRLRAAVRRGGQRLEVKGTATCRTRDFAEGGAGRGLQRMAAMRAL